MPENKIVGYKQMFGFVLPDWVDERMIRYTAFGLLSIVVMFMVLIFLIWPNAGTVEVQKKKLEVNREALAALKNSKNGIDLMQSGLTTKEQDVLLSAIPQQYSPETAIYMLRSISNDSGVSITSYTLPSGVLMSPTGGIAVTGKTNGEMVQFTSFPIKLTVAAPVDALLDFIAKFESSLPFGIVSDLNLQEITKLSTAGANKPVQLLLEVTFYQSSLRSVNINKMEPITAEDISLAKSLSKYNLLNVSDQQEDGSASSSATVTGSVFGF